MIHILLVDDDPILGRGLVITLEAEGYKVSWAQTTTKAAQIEFDKNLDLVILDLNLPDGSGLDFLKKIRMDGSKIPIIILTAKTSEQDVVLGFNHGANDYVRKPFGGLELLARIKSALQQPQVLEPKVRFRDLTLLIDKRQVFYQDKEISLSRRQFDILLFMVGRPGAVVTRESLIHLIDREGEIFDRTVDSHLSMLRKQLKKAGVDSISIQSVYGIGYRFDIADKVAEK